MAISRRLNDLPQADDGAFVYVEAADGSQVRVPKSTLLEGVARWELLEQSEMEELKASDCVEGILYIGLDEVVDTEGAWTFGGTFPIRLT